MITPNRKAFLDTIAYSELGAELLAVSDNGYNVIVGSTPQHPDLFDSYADHPRKAVFIPRLGITSTAAGRYQDLEHYFDVYKKQLNLPDFSPASQDAIALQQISERNALHLVDAGNFDGAILRCDNIWASLPGAGYGQHVNKMSDLRSYYCSKGGVLLNPPPTEPQNDPSNIANV